MRKSEENLQTVAIIARQQHSLHSKIEQQFPGKPLPAEINHLSSGWMKRKPNTQVAKKRTNWYQTLTVQWWRWLMEIGLFSTTSGGQRVKNQKIHWKLYSIMALLQWSSVLFCLVWTKVLPVMCIRYKFVGIQLSNLLKWSRWIGLVREDLDNQKTKNIATKQFQCFLMRMAWLPVRIYQRPSRCEHQKLGDCLLWAAPCRQMCACMS